MPLRQREEIQEVPRRVSELSFGIFIELLRIGTRDWHWFRSRRGTTGHISLTSERAYR